MIALTWSSRHFRCASSCAALRQPLACGLNLRPSLYKSQPSLVIGWFLSSFHLWHMCVVKFVFPVFWKFDRDWWPSVFRCAIIVSGQAFNFGNTVMLFIGKMISSMVIVLSFKLWQYRGSSLSYTQWWGQRQRRLAHLLVIFADIGFR